MLCSDGDVYINEHSDQACFMSFWNS